MLISFFLWSFSFAHAGLSFNCYDNPNIPVMAYQVGSLNCPQPPKGSISDTKNVFCVYTAICEPLAENQRPTKLTEEQVSFYSEAANFVEFQNSSFKNSLVTCAGKAKVDGNKWLSGDCPPLNDCAKDIAFNGTAAAINGAALSLQKPAGKGLIRDSGITK